MSIVELFPKARKLAYDARSFLTALQNEVAHPSLSSSSSSSNLPFALQELSNQLTLLDKLVSLETPQNRDIWYAKIGELKEQCHQLQGEAQYYEGLKAKQSSMRQTQNPLQAERESLLAGAQSRKQRNMMMGGATAAGGEEGMSEFVDTGRSLDRSNQNVGELLAQGSASLSGLLEQRGRLKGVRKMVLDIATTLGISNQTLRAIERRDVSDRFLVIGGMIIVCIVLYLCFGR